MLIQSTFPEEDWRVVSLTCLSTEEINNIGVGFIVYKNAMPFVFTIFISLQTPYLSSPNSLCHDVHCYYPCYYHHYY